MILRGWPSFRQYNCVQALQQRQTRKNTTSLFLAFTKEIAGKMKTFTHITQIWKNLYKHGLQVCVFFQVCCRGYIVTSLCTNERMISVQFKNLEDILLTLFALNIKKRYCKYKSTIIYIGPWVFHIVLSFYLLYFYSNRLTSFHFNNQLWLAFYDKNIII